MAITDVDRLERILAIIERLRGRARHLPYGELDRRIMHEAADLFEELKPLANPEPKPKPKRKKKNVKS